jgi:acyl-CoA thioesterase YciA
MKKGKKHPPAREPAIRVILLPKDTNAHGTIFGGVIMSYVDLAGAVEAYKHTTKRIVTVAMHEIKFKAPVYVGDLVSFYTRTLKIGNTSITIKVEVDVTRGTKPHVRPTRVTEAEVVFVAVNEKGKPVPIRD